jgi:hypothetical protein
VALVDEDAVEEFAADGADEAFGDGVARDARAGVRMTWIPLQVKTASKMAVNVASRSRMRNRIRLPAS